MQRDKSINCTDMGHVDQMTRELIEWLERKQQQNVASSEAPNTPRRSTRSDHALDQTLYFSVPERPNEG